MGLGLLQKIYPDVFDVVMEVGKKYFEELIDAL